MTGAAVVLWSGGKDCCMSLYRTLLYGEYSVAALITTVTDTYDRISMHGVRSELLRRQAGSLRLDLRSVEIPAAATNDVYEERMDSVLSGYARSGVSTVICGDIFLEDIREYREEMFRRNGLRGKYPVWGTNTSELAREFVDLGFRAKTVCVDPVKLDGSFCGRNLNHAFLEELPAGVDPCGENGEFHTFVYDGLIFGSGIAHAVGDTVTRDGFVFTDLLPR